MLKTLRTRFRQGYRTAAYPKTPITLVEDYRGLPSINWNCSPELVHHCAENCPQAAIDAQQKLLDLGRCVFCGSCQELSEGRFISFSNHPELAVSDRSQLYMGEGTTALSVQLNRRIQKLFGRSLQLRQVSAGGCNACEADLNVLGTPFFDLARFGIDFAASPRHADGLIVTGPVTVNMKTALLKTYEAVPDPKIVIASGTCAVSGGPFYDSPEIVDWIDTLIPVDLFIPGCPPHPLTALHALLTFLGRV